METLFIHFYCTRKLFSINFLFFMFMSVYNYIFIFIKIKKGMSTFPLDFMVRKGWDFLAHVYVCVCLTPNCRSVFCLEYSRYSIIECFQNFFSQMTVQNILQQGLDSCYLRNLSKGKKATCTEVYRILQSVSEEPCSLMLLKNFKDDSEW